MKTLSYLNSLRTEVEESEEEDVSVIVVGVDMEYDCVVGEIFTSTPLLPLPTFFFGGRRGSSNGNRFPLRSRSALLRRFIE